jgi:hypothetical protein
MLRKVARCQIFINLDKVFLVPRCFAKFLLKRKSSVFSKNTLFQSRNLHFSVPARMLSFIFLFERACETAVPIRVHILKEPS